MDTVKQLSHVFSTKIIIAIDFSINAVKQDMLNCKGGSACHTLRLLFSFQQVRVCDTRMPDSAPRKNYLLPATDPASRSPFAEDRLNTVQLVKNVSIPGPLPLRFDKRKDAGLKISIGYLKFTDGAVKRGFGSPISTVIP